MTTWLTWAAALLAAAAIAAPAAAQDGTAAGQALFQHTCANCHSTRIGVNKVGPSLWHVIGRPVASVPDFPYSDTLRAMRKDWPVWDATTLDAYLSNPRQVLHGVKMYFKGLPDANDRAAVIAYLATLK